VTIARWDATHGQLVVKLTVQQSVSDFYRFDVNARQKVDADDLCIQNWSIFRN
jgi:hypothetical protein